MFFRFDLEAFYTEMARVLRPQGTLAAWMYHIPRFNVPDADAALHHWYKGVLGAYWSERRALVDTHYHGTHEEGAHTCNGFKQHDLTHVRVFSRYGAGDWGPF